MKQKIKLVITYGLVIWFIICVVSLLLVYDNVTINPGPQGFFVVLHLVWSILFLATALLCGKKYLGIKNAMAIALMMVLFIMTILLFCLVY